MIMPTRPAVAFNVTEAAVRSELATKFPHLLRFVSMQTLNFAHVPPPNSAGVAIVSITEQTCSDNFTYQLLARQGYDWPVDLGDFDNNYTYVGMRVSMLAYIQKCSHYPMIHQLQWWTGQLFTEVQNATAVILDGATFLPTQLIAISSFGVEGCGELVMQVELYFILAPNTHYTIMHFLLRPSTSLRWIPQYLSCTPLTLAPPPALSLLVFPRPLRP
jgi:hypothetical protein